MPQTIVALYDVVKDIMRIEGVVSAGVAAKGYICVLTNDPIYWKPQRDDEIHNKDAFRLHEGKRLAGTLTWREGARVAKDRAAALSVKGSYPLHWKDYSDLGGGKAARFRYLLLEVKPDLS